MIPTRKLVFNYCSSVRIKTANKMALLICAEPTFNEYFIGIDKLSLSESVIGNFPLLCLIKACIFSKGSIILIIGLLESESSPVKVALMFLVDNKPTNNRNPVPELPKI